MYIAMSKEVFDNMDLLCKRKGMLVSEDDRKFVDKVRNDYDRNKMVWTHNTKRIGELAAAVKKMLEVQTDLPLDDISLEDVKDGK